MEVKSIKELGKNEFNQQIGKWIREKRNKYDITQKQLAFQLDCKRNNIAMIERGSVTISLFQYIKILAFFNSLPKSVKINITEE